MRRAILAAIDADPDGDPPVIGDQVLRAVLDDFSSERESLSRSLLGGTPPPPADLVHGDPGGGPGRRPAPGLAPGGAAAGPVGRARLGRGWTTYRPG
jgi:hypothetical protein